MNPVTLFLYSLLVLFNMYEGVLQPCVMDMDSSIVTLPFSLKKLCLIYQEICASLRTEFVRTLFPALRLQPKKFC